MSDLSKIMLTRGSRFVNDGASAVPDSLAGVILSNPDVGLLDYGQIVIVRNYLHLDTVRVLSGGSSGHEPAYSGYVGKGMLTAAVQGEIFTCPTMSTILRTIRELDVNNGSGILVIIQNNLNDRLNFGLAVERARSRGISVKLIVVSEDCCSPPQRTGKRGLSGIVLIQKIAGAMAEMGSLLDNIYIFCRTAEENMRSISLSWKCATAPIEETCTCLKQMAAWEVEFGSGLHGEVGAKRMRKTTVTDICKKLLNELVTENFMLDSSTPVVVMINNLGTALPVEERVFVKEFLSCLLQFEVPIVRIYQGSFYTVLDMSGYSVTIMKVFDKKLLQYLDDPCEAPAWKPTKKVEVTKVLLNPIASSLKIPRRQIAPGLQLREEYANVVMLAIQFACDALISCEKQINTIDTETGSGDMGLRIKSGAAAILEEIKKKTLDYRNLQKFFQALSIICEKVIGATSGFIYSILFEAAASFFQRSAEVNGYLWLDCMKECLEKMQRCVEVEFGENTMFDALSACVNAMETGLDAGNRSVEAFGMGVAAAETAALKTRILSRKYSDPGAHVVGIWMRAVYEGMKMRLE